jgi:hypothetical protein
MERAKRGVISANQKTGIRQVILSITISHFVLFARMLSAVDSFQKPAIKGFHTRVRISEWSLPPSTRICIFAFAPRNPFYLLDRTGRTVRASQRALQILLAGVHKITISSV